MADTTSQFTVIDTARAGLGRFLASIMERLESYAHVRSRRDQIDALEALSDAELAKMGITREEIVHHVFRDLYFA